MKENFPLCLLKEHYINKFSYSKKRLISYSKSKAEGDPKLK